MDEPKNVIGRAIKEGLKRKNMSQKDLAEIMKVSKSSVTYWVKGLSFPPGDKLIKIIRDLDIVNDLFSNYVKKEEQKEEESELRREITSLKKKMELIENYIFVEKLTEKELRYLANLKWSIGENISNIDKK